MNPSYRIISIISVLSALLCSCQQTSVSRGGSVGVRNYSDAVVHISQVDPAYRAYFRDQDAVNYSISDQRKAYIAAAQTARTPVRASDYRPGDIRRRAIVSRKVAKGKAGVAARRGVNSRVSVATQRGKAPAVKGKTAAKKNAVAARKPYRRR